MGLHQKNCICLLFFAIILCALSASAFAIILHSNGEPDVTWTDRPNDLVVGRWSWNSCFVVIAPNWILTTRHQNTTPATVNIDGVNYNCISNSQWIGGPLGNSDIQVVRLTTPANENPNLANFAEIYINTDEIDRDIVIGGHGNGRGNVIIPGMRYEWDYASGNSSPLRWATNTVDGTGTILIDGDNIYTSKVLVAYFSAHTTADDDYEGIAAIYDSGGGWFTKQSSNWELAGLTRAVQWHGTSLYSDAQAWTGDYQDAVRVSAYASWIDAIITCTGDMDGDVNDDCIVNFADLLVLASEWLREDCDGSNNNCNGADTNPADGYVDMIDFTAIAADWLIAN